MDVDTEMADLGKDIEQMYTFNKTSQEILDHDMQDGADCDVKPVIESGSLPTLLRR